MPIAPQQQPAIVVQGAAQAGQRNAVLQQSGVPDAGKVGPVLLPLCSLVTCSSGLGCLSIPECGSDIMLIVSSARCLPCGAGVGASGTAERSAAAELGSYTGAACRRHRRRWRGEPGVVPVCSRTCGSRLLPVRPGCCSRVGSFPARCPPLWCRGRRGRDSRPRRCSGTLHPSSGLRTGSGASGGWEAMCMVPGRPR